MRVCISLFALGPGLEEAEELLVCEVEVVHEPSAPSLSLPSLKLFLVDGLVAGGVRHVGALARQESIVLLSRLGIAQSLVGQLGLLPELGIRMISGDVWVARPSLFVKLRSDLLLRGVLADPEECVQVRLAARLVHPPWDAHQGAGLAPIQASGRQLLRSRLDLYQR